MSVNPFSPKIAVINITDKCILSCDFCNNSKKNFNVMSLDTFKRVIDNFISLGIFSFEITPTVGDSITVPNLSDYFDILENNPYVRCYFWFTGLAFNNNLDSIFFNRKKLYTVISIYGLTEKSFISRTNSSKYIFSIFFKNLNKVFSFSNSTIIFRNRTTSKFDDTLFSSFASKYSSFNFFFEKLSVDTFSTSSKTNVCCNFFINFGCFINGDITTCAYADFKKNSIIGNILTDDLSCLSSKLSNYYLDFLDMPICSNCSLYDPINYSGSNFSFIFNESFTFNSFIDRSFDFHIGSIDFLKDFSRDIK
jgi:hypothetical protein